MRKPKVAPTPGPYEILERSGGFVVNGIHGVGIAWFGENGTYGAAGSYTVSHQEAKVNAEAFVEALKEVRE